MLMPKKVKYRKTQRGRRKGLAWRGSTLAFGDYGLKAMRVSYVTDRQLEAAAVACRDDCGRQRGRRGIISTGSHPLARRISIDAGGAAIARPHLLALGYTGLWRRNSPGSAPRSFRIKAWFEKVGTGFSKDQA